MLGGREGEGEATFGRGGVRRLLVRKGRGAGYLWGRGDVLLDFYGSKVTLETQTKISVKKLRAETCNEYQPSLSG